MKKGMLVALAAVVLGSFGCSSALEWTNDADYRTMAFDTSREGLLVSLENESTSEEAEYLCLQVAQALAMRGGYRVRYMAAGNVKADIRLKMRIDADHSGRFTNLFVSFPGYLIFTQGWLGNGYEVTYDVTCTIENAVTKESIGTVRIPIVLNLRHTDGGRAWADCLIWPVAPFALINGLYCITYDDDVTPLLNTAAYPTLGEYIATQLIARINVEPEAPKAQPAPRTAPRTASAPAPAPKAEASAQPAPKPAPAPKAEAAPAPKKASPDPKAVRELKSLLDFGIIDQKTYEARLKALQ